MRRLRITAYIVRHNEDGQCPNCGWPSDVGDTCYEVDGTDSGYCSRACAAANMLAEERYNRAHA
jgi:hypothetical protein